MKEQVVTCMNVEESIKLQSIPKDQSLNLLNIWLSISNPVVN